MDSIFGGTSAPSEIDNDFTFELSRLADANDGSLTSRAGLFKAGLS